MTGISDVRKLVIRCLKNGIYINYIFSKIEYIHIYKHLSRYLECGKHTFFMR